MLQLKLPTSWTPVRPPLLESKKKKKSFKVGGANVRELSASSMRYQWSKREAKGEFSVCSRDDYISFAHL